MQAKADEGSKPGYRRMGGGEEGRRERQETLSVLYVPRCESLSRNVELYNLVSE